jgi:hypothetical protein
MLSSRAFHSRQIAFWRGARQAGRRFLRRAGFRRLVRRGFSRDITLTARDGDQHEGRHQIAKSLHGRAQIIAPIPAAIIAVLTRGVTIAWREITHGGFPQGKFARLRIAVPARGVIPPRCLSRLRRFGAGAAFRAFAPRGRFGCQIFRRFRARGAV